MYNSCTYNAFEYNSLCLREVIEPIERGSITVRQRRRKVLYKQFFDIIGLKLFFTSRIFNILGFILLANKYQFKINADKLFILQNYFYIQGNKQNLNTFKQDIIAFKEFLKTEEIDVNLLKLFLEQQNYELSGIKLNDLISSQELQGQKKFYNTELKQIFGQKDIHALLEALDLIDEE